MPLHPFSYVSPASVSSSREVPGAKNYSSKENLVPIAHHKFLSPRLAYGIIAPISVCNSVPL